MSLPLPVTGHAYIPCQAGKSRLGRGVAGLRRSPRGRDWGREGGKEGRREGQREKGERAEGTHTPTVRPAAWIARRGDAEQLHTSSLRADRAKLPLGSNPTSPSAGEQH